MSLLAEPSRKTSDGAMTEHRTVEAILDDLAVEA